jgi:hypothetical protein
MLKDQFWVKQEEGAVQDFVWKKPMELLKSLEEEGVDIDLQVDPKYLHLPTMKVILHPPPKLSLGLLDLYWLVFGEGNWKELIVLGLNLRFGGIMFLHQNPIESHRKGVGLGILNPVKLGLGNGYRPDYGVGVGGLEWSFEGCWGPLAILLF